MTYELCGDCLHAKSSHHQLSPVLMHCNRCNKSCEKVEFDKVHHSSKILIHDGIVTNMNLMKKPTKGDSEIAK